MAETDDNKGCKVRLEHRQIGSVVYRNVTEIHWNYNRQEASHFPAGSHLNKLRVAFESDVHGTGCTWNTEDVLEFDTDLETEIAENF